MATEKQTKKEMIQSEASFEEIQKVYKSTTKQEVGFMAYKLSLADGKTYQIDGLDTGDCYINRKGDILIPSSVVSTSKFEPGDSFIFESDKKGIALNFSKKITLPPVPTEEEKQQKRERKEERLLSKAMARKI